MRRCRSRLEGYLTQGEVRQGLDRRTVWLSTRPEVGFVVPRVFSLNSLS